MPRGRGVAGRHKNVLGDSVMKAQKAAPDRILVAMSGGVDSSTAAWLLAKQGLDVVGATLVFWPPEPERLVRRPGSAPAEALGRAKAVCERIGIPHVTIHDADRFWSQVVKVFCSEYAAGRTPNPCVICNPRVKWALLLEEADKRGCAKVATGHYARLLENSGRIQILRGADRTKDQSYALYRLDQEALARTVFPLGSLSKREVRRLAAEAGLGVASAPESQDLCFLPKGGYADFLRERLPMSPGPIEDLEGRTLGTHRGLGLYTVGQRKGLGIPFGTPLYVVAKDPARNRLVVGPREALCRTLVLVEEVNWVSMEPPVSGTCLSAEVELRYRARPLRAEILVRDRQRVEIRLPPHGQAVAPGQSAVWYNGEVLLGGGVLSDREGISP